MTTQERHDRIDRLMKRAYRLNGYARHLGDRITISTAFALGLRIASIGMDAELLADDTQ